MKPRIVTSPDSDSWVAMAAEVIRCKIDEVVSNRGICNVMLTGGNTVEALYTRWATRPLPFDRIRFFFGDERCVPPDHIDSNYALVMRTLLAEGPQPGCSIARMEAENPDREAAARAYEKLLPEAVDILLLGMGIDGHIASLFPYSHALQPSQRTVVPAVGQKTPNERLTITPKVIKLAKSIFLLAMGEEKGKVLAEALKSQKDIMRLPVCLLLEGTWLLDDKAALQVIGNCKR